MKLTTPKINPYQVVLPMFEGPLDLLLHLIREHKLDIYDIPIVEVTDQYMQYLSMMESLDLDIAGEFLVVAATLLEIKSKMLLPPDPKESDDEEEIDPRLELVERLIEYQRYKEASEMFRELEVERAQVFRSGAKEPEIDYAPFLLKDITPNILLEALQRVLSDVGEGEEEVTTITRRRISIRMKMSEIWRMVSSSENGVLFHDLFEDSKDRTDVVITFLAILELLKLHRVTVHQDEMFGHIEIRQYEAENE